MAHASRPLAEENSGESPRAEYPAEQAGVATLRQSEARYRSLFAAMEQGFCIIEKVATLPDEPSDYRYLAVNQAFVRHCGLLDVLGKTVRQVVPGAENHILAAYDEALASGEARQFEEYIATLDIWIAAEILPDTQPGCLAVLFSNVSARHQAATLRESVKRQSYLLALSDALRPELDAAAVQAAVTQAALHYFRADRCYYAEVAGDALTIRQDAAQPGLPSLAAAYSLSATPLFRALLQPRQPVVVADVHAAPLLADDIRQLCQASHLLAYITVPIIRQSELVGVLCLAQRTPRQWTSLELTLVQETAERTWAAVERARAEEALRRSETQFRSLVEATSDTVYKMSADGQQISQIFDRDFLADKPSARGTWLEQYIPVADQPQVQAATEAAVRAKAMFELEHRVIQADGSAGWAYSRAIPLLDAQGAITEWLGTAQNVTARKQAEAQLRDFTAHLEQLVAERTQAFLHAQEAERSRIAESLHNGLGQLLYAIKLQVSQLDVPALHTLPALNEVRKYTNQLLAEAIQQTRTLSHELMPVALSEQGLGPALRAICRGLSTPQLRLTCQVWLDEQVLSPPLQTALYRLAQELAHNIAKHSGASQGKLEFEMLPGWINLRAEDNGHGFDTTTTAWGLGLRLLHEAVGLLGGTILVESSGEYGTYIRLHIPIT